MSYINNLHPKEHPSLYKSLALIFERFVPLFNNVLTDLLRKRPNRISVDYEWYPPREEEEDEEKEDAAFELYFETRVPIEPTVPEVYVPPPDPEPVKIVSLNNRSLQVIVKLAHIVLTPEKPNYSGGVWHVEGMTNEHIVASGIYYYISDNITESRLEFRAKVEDPPYEQNDDRGVKFMFGLENEGPLCQNLGYIVTEQDRCIAFPNLFQHRVAPMQLIDKTRPGYRKILVFFLVDPLIKIPSTAIVPPQQSSWFLRELRRIPAFKIFPNEVLERIVSFMDGTMNLTEAQQYRTELMAERKFFIRANSECVFERPFSLCEH